DRPRLELRPVVNDPDVVVRVQPASVPAPAVAFAPDLRDAGATVPLRADGRVSVVVADRAEVAEQYGLILPRSREHLPLGNRRVEGQRDYRVLSRQDRFEVVEVRIADELHPGVEERVAVRSRVVRHPLVIDPDPRLVVP